VIRDLRKTIEASGRRRKRFEKTEKRRK